MLSSALDSAFGGALPAATDDGADHIADIVAAVAGDKRAVIDERRAAAQAATRERVRTASAAAERRRRRDRDAGRARGPRRRRRRSPTRSDLPDKAELERLRTEVARASPS